MPKEEIEHIRLACGKFNRLVNSADVTDRAYCAHEFNPRENEKGTPASRSFRQLKEKS